MNVVNARQLVLLEVLLDGQLLWIVGGLNSALVEPQSLKNWVFGQCPPPSSLAPSLLPSHSVSSVSHLWTKSTGEA
jgi:hypothetical protein